LSEIIEIICGMQTVIFSGREKLLFA